MFNFYDENLLANEDFWNAKYAGWSCHFDNLDPILIDFDVMSIIDEFVDLFCI